MDAQQQGILTLLRSAVTGEALSLPEGFDLDAAYTLIKAHKIAPLAYEGALHCGVSQQHPVMMHLFQASCRAIQVNERQMRELHEIYAAFEEAGVDYLPLKGSIMKAMYPRPELRLMGDADILIRQEQYVKVRPIMESLGYYNKASADDVIIWSNNALYLELHISLFDSQHKELYAYFIDGWAFAKVKEGNCYMMTPEDAFIYEIAHFVKHYGSFGIGCRHMVDLWVYLRNYPALNEIYIQNELEKLQLWTFYRHLRHTLAWWFEDAVPDETTELISEVVFSSGSWGTERSAAIWFEMKEQNVTSGSVKTRATYVLRRVFPKGEKLKQFYPVLDRHPWLLPAVWLRYIFTKIFAHKLTLRQHINKMKWLTDEDLKNKWEMLHKVGLK